MESKVPRPALVESIEYQIKVSLKLTPGNVETLMQHSRVHYDGVCKQAGAQGGFIYGWKNALEMGIETISTDFRQIDTCCKILEFTTKDDAAELYWKLDQCLRYINDLYAEANQ